MFKPVLKTKHRSVGPRKGVGNGFQPGTVNPSGKKTRKATVVHENDPYAPTLGDVARVTRQQES